MLGGTGFIAPFLNLFYVRTGLSGTDVGIVTATGSIVMLIAAPLWTDASRKMQSPRRLLQIALMFTAVAFLVLGMQNFFWGILIVTILRALASAGISPLSDAITLSVTHASKTGFGGVRVWASIGWIFCSLLSGWLIEHVGFGAAFAGVFSVTILSVFILSPIAPHHFKPTTSGQEKIGLATTLRRLIHNRAMLGLAAMLTIVGMMNSGIVQFETVYLSTLGASESLLGVASVMSATVEIPMMLWADRLTQTYGARRLLLLSMILTGAVRALVLIAPSIVSIFIERAIGGVGFSFYTVALIAFMNAHSHPEETGTVIALYNVTLVNLIGIFASPITGAVYDAFGARSLYALALSGYALGWLALKVTGDQQTKPQIS